MYHFFLKRRLRHVVERLNAGDYAFIKGQFAPDAVHWFSGEHALGGQRSTATDIARWYERLPRVFPGLTFTVLELIVMGPPWNTRAVLEWVDHAKDRNGAPLPNQGTFVIQLAWGRVKSFHVYCDTARLVRNLGIVSSQGCAEAALPPIVTLAA